MKDPKGKARIAEAVTLCFNGLRQYGKEPESLTDTIKLFHFVLADYPVQKIVEALAFYCKYRDEMPVPSDIRNIIERGNKPPFEKSIYVTISRMDPVNRTTEEWEYMREYQNFMISGF